jgi:hypothetical protein
VDAAGHWRSGVFEAPWRVGGASTAEVVALAEFQRDPALQNVEVSRKEFGANRRPPGGAVVHFCGDDPEVGPVMRYTLVKRRQRRKQPQATPPAPQQIELDTAAIDRVLGAKGNNNGGVYQFGIPRAEPIKDGGMVVPASMGSAQGINFQPTGGGKAAITGDFVLTAKEVPLVLKALRGNGIEVTAVHNHMLDEEPRLFFVHFWGNDDAVKLAQGLKAALAHVNVAKG